MFVDSKKAYESVPYKTLWWKIVCGQIALVYIFFLSVYLGVGIVEVGKIM